MVDLAELKRHEGSRLELCFADGYVAHVKLISVDEDSPGDELIYLVDTVVTWGALDPATVDLSEGHTADAAQLLDWTLLP